MTSIDKVKNAMLAIQRYPWEQGVCAQALYELSDETWICMAHDAVLRQQEDGRLAVINDNIAVTDPASNGEVVYRAYERTGDDFYLSAANKMKDYLKNVAPRSHDGVIFHNDISFDEKFTEKQFWIDSAYMAPPFLAVMDEIDDAILQIKGLFKYLLDEETGVLFHNYDYGSKRFIRRLRWATGNGWALMGISRVISELRTRGLTDACCELVQLGNDLLISVLKYQLEDGRFHDIMDDETSFIDGTSSMMVAAYIYRGIFEGYVDKKYIENANKAYDTVTSKIDEYGIIREVCGCPHFVSEGTSAEAQASYLIASAWKINN